MYVCIYVARTAQDVHMCTPVYMYICTYVSMYVCMYVRMYVCMFVCVYVCMCACMYVCMYACLHVYMYVCMCVCDTMQQCFEAQWLRPSIALARRDSAKFPRALARVRKRVPANEGLSFRNKNHGRGISERLVLALGKKSYSANFYVWYWQRLAVV